MNRSMGYAGLGLVLVGVAMVASPIVLLGHEVLDTLQIAGFLVAPVGLVVILIAAVSFDPTRTTVRGTVIHETSATGRRPVEPSGGAHFANPRAPVHCPYCRTVITYDLARCPRCARDRPCRSCGRPLDLVQEQVTCPGCSRPEFYCNCPNLGRSIVPVRTASKGRIY